MPQTTYLTAEAANAARDLGQALAAKGRELKEFFDLVAKQIADAPAPAPSCDSPHCACVDGTDCPANAAADPVQDSYGRLNRWQQASAADTARTARSLAARVRARHVPLWTLAWKGDRFEVTDGIVTAETDVLSRDATVQDSVVAINALVRGMRLNMIAMESVVGFRDDGNGKVTPIYGDPDHDPLTDALPERILAALNTNGVRLDGFTAKLDALAERLERKAGSFDVTPSAVNILPPGVKVTDATPHAMDRDVRAAVMALQKALGIREDGRVGPATMTAIENIRSWPKGG